MPANPQSPAPAGPKPAWLRRKLPRPGKSGAIQKTLDDLALHTVCKEAQCPNRAQCYGNGTATFLLLGPSCSRRCTFCSVDKSPLAPPDPDEPQRVARAVLSMDLSFCVLTMVTRDDMVDGGAAHVAATVDAVRQSNPGIGIEVLISDLGGGREALRTVLECQPQVLNHNVETVVRLYPDVRPQADYERSLQVLSRVRAMDSRAVTKSGLMLGLGETRDEVLAVLDDLRQAGCSSLTLGQYLAPTRRHHPVIRYVTPEEFEDYEEQANQRGFSAVASGPFVRSSFKAEALYRKALGRLDGR